MRTKLGHVSKRVGIGLVLVACVGLAGWGIYAYRQATKPVITTPVAERPVYRSQPSATVTPKTDDTSTRTARSRPDDPQTLTIPKLGVAAPIVPLGLTSTGAIAAPARASDAGWFRGSARPGQPGAVIIDGHTTISSNSAGVFDNLSQLKIGDTLSITRGDGAIFSYTVVSVQIVNLSEVNMALFMRPYGSAKQGLNLITCAGELVGSGSNQTLNKRVLVFTEQKT